MREINLDIHLISDELRRSGRSNFNLRDFIFRVQGIWRKSVCDKLVRLRLCAINIIISEIIISFFQRLMEFLRLTSSYVIIAVSKASVSCKSGSMIIRLCLVNIRDVKVAILSLVKSPLLKTSFIRFWEWGIRRRGMRGFYWE